MVASNTGQEAGEPVAAAEADVNDAAEQEPQSHYAFCAAAIGEYAVHETGKAIDYAIESEEDA